MLEINLASIAKEALHNELLTYPKPGLVSMVDSGSHTDMDHTTYIASINSLDSYFTNITDASASNVPFLTLNQLGLDAEISMLKATNNINTHRGAIFILGILVAATSNAFSNKLPYNQISSTISNLWGKELLLHTANKESHGSLVRNKYKLANLIVDAAVGFPDIFLFVDEYEVLLTKYTSNDARIILFLKIMQSLDDTNLVYRGGLDGLNYAKHAAGKILSDATSIEDLKSRSVLLHKEFILRNLSPGGCADVLAAVLFLFSVKMLYLQLESE